MKYIIHKREEELHQSYQVILDPIHPIFIYDDRQRCGSEICHF